MKITRLLFAMLAIACFTAVSAFAADVKPEGTWTWSQPGRDAEISVSLLIESKAGKLVGAFTNPNQTVDVADLEVKGDDISFSIAGRRGGATKYTGKIAGDAITGSIEIPARGGGEPKKIDWKGKRGAPAAKKE